MRLRDLRRKIKAEQNKPTFFWFETEFKPQFLLEDKRSYAQINLERKWNWYLKLKAKNVEFFKILKLCESYVELKISLRKNLISFPYYKRGTKGFLLHVDAKLLFPLHLQAEIDRVEKTNGSKLIMFEHTVVTLPQEYFKFCK